MGHLSELIITFGYIGVFITVFAESGFLLGFFLPGDSMLFTVGILASQGYFNIGWMIFLAITAAILGDTFGYYIGRVFGKRLFNRPESRLFKYEYVQRTEEFYKKYGKRTIIMARFVPIVRTFAPIMAGVGKMDYKIFASYNVVGGFLWAGGLLGLSYYLGTRFEGIENYLTYIIIGIIVVSFIPIALDFLKKK
ncbi:VTT domain-containing protein [Candidatus Parcubacteria bacterium]|nr:VTT domain-containing protein [Candidatus Parcubacteria bacterium]